MEDALNMVVLDTTSPNRDFPQSSKHGYPPDSIEELLFLLFCLTVGGVDACMMSSMEHYHLGRNCNRYISSLSCYHPGIMNQKEAEKHFKRGKE